MMSYSLPAKICLGDKIICRKVRAVVKIEKDPLTGKWGGKGYFLRSPEWVSSLTPQSAFNIYRLIFEPPLIIDGERFSEIPISIEPAFVESRKVLFRVGVFHKVDSGETNEHIRSEI